jgi:hypothetical protein
MRLTHPQPPAESVEALSGELANLASGGHVGARVLGRANPDDMTATVPQQVFRLDVADLKGRRGLDAARPAGWRYLVEVGERVVAAAQTRVTDDGRHAFGHLNEGPFVAGTVRALHALDVMDDAAGGGAGAGAEVRLLQVPALYFVGLWLHGEKGDTVVPVEPAPPEFEANKPYPAEEALRMLGERADSIPELAADDTRGG